MTHEDAGHNAAKHPRGTELNTKLAEALKGKSRDGQITCAAAHRIARELEVSPADVGVALDLLELRIGKCQLGLFGYGPQKKAVKPAEKVSPKLEEALRKSVVDNRVSCLSCWEIARGLSLVRMDVCAACESLNIKIVSCQIGAFR